LLVTTRRTAGLADPVIARVAAGAMKAAMEASRSVTIGCYDETIDYLPDPENLPHPVRSGVASKFLLFGPPNASLFQALTKRGSPAISLGYEYQGTGVLSLLPDYQMASQLALEHLFRLGHQRVGIISGPFGATDAQILELNRGVRIAFEQARLPIETHNVLYGDLSNEAGVLAFEALAAREPQPTAVFCMSDAAAAGVMVAAHSRGWKVPGDLSVIGCSDDALAPFTFPPLTTIRIPAEEMAIRGAHEIERLVRDGILHEQRKELLPVRLVERGSSGPLSARKANVDR
jgi:LacI family repressor for deo operon, udp, cdd, tsx, nupC, and nupG